MISIRNLDVFEVALDRDRICGGILVSAQESLTFVDTDSILFVSAFALTDGISFASAFASATTISSSGDSSSSSFSSSAI